MIVKKFLKSHLITILLIFNGFGNKNLQLIFVIFKKRI